MTAVKASSARGRIEIQTSRPVPRTTYARAIEKAGYRLGVAQPWFSRDRSVWRDLAIGAAVVGVLAFVISQLGFGELTAGAGSALATGGLVLVIGLGVAAGFSTCMAMVGGLVLAVSARYNEGREDQSLKMRLRPQLIFGAGRIAGFTVLGGIVGALGSMVSLSGPTLAIAMILVAIVMTLLALQLTEISPKLAGLSLTLPTFLTSRLGGQSEENTGSATPSGRLVITRDFRTAALGAATFFLPCGFTQAVQVYALSTGSALSGALTMLFFAIGTMPGLLAIGGLAAAVRGTAAKKFFRIAGVTVMAFALVNFTAAFSVLAPGVSIAGIFGQYSAAATTVSENVTIVDGVQHITITHGPSGYQPENSVIYQGFPSKLDITSTTFDCGISFAAPELGTDNVMLNMETPTTIDFTPEVAGTLHFGCTMGMITGTLTVLDHDPKA